MLTTELKRHLPYARRFARALCGNQQEGDAYVKLTLEKLLQDRGSLERFHDSKKALYATFIKLWSEEEHPCSPACSSQPTVDRNIQALSPLSRQAFLLLEMENFSVPEIGQILDVPISEVRLLIKQAQQEIREQIATDVLIIEDQWLVATRCEALVRLMGHRVTGVAANHQEAIKLAQQKRPGLVLADVKLAGNSSGLDAVNEMLEDFSVPVVFITGFPERLLTGAKPEPAFLITKPFDTSMLTAVITQALFFDEQAHPGRVIH